MREADVAIRMKEPSQADLIRKRLMNVNMRLFATSEYLRANGTPAIVDDLSDYRLISQNVTSAQVSVGAQLIRELNARTLRSTFTVNNYFGVLQAVLNHLGIGVLPDYVSEDFPRTGACPARSGERRYPGISGLPRRIAPFAPDCGLPRFRCAGNSSLPPGTPDSALTDGLCLRHVCNA